jgi:hypothetical protein
MERRRRNTMRKIKIRLRRRNIYGVEAEKL